MNLPKSTFLLMVLLLVACKKPSPAKVWLCDSEGVTILNGNVKYISIVNSQYLVKAEFDEKGDLKYSARSTLTGGEDGQPKDSTVAVQKFLYSTLYDSAGKKIAITGNLDDDAIHKSKWEFDKRGRVTNYIADTNDPSYCKNHYKYDNKGYLIEYERNYCMKFDSDLHKYKYDGNHLIVESSLYYSNEQIMLSKTDYKYLHFDSNNNWTQCISYKETYPPLQKDYKTDTITRKITYY